MVRGFRQRGLFPILRDNAAAFFLSGKGDKICLRLTIRWPGVSANIFDRPVSDRSQIGTVRRLDISSQTEGLVLDGNSDGGVLQTRPRISAGLIKYLVVDRCCLRVYTTVCTSFIYLL